MLPNKRLCQAVRQWNDAGLQPPLRIVTIDQAMDRARKQSNSLAVVRGEWADWWANGHGSSAYEVAVSRIARSELRTAEMADALVQFSSTKGQNRILSRFLPITNWYRSGSTPPVRDDWYKRIGTAWDDLLMFEEHTWGTFETITQPFSLFTQTHWNSKAGFAFRALTEAHDLSREALVALASTLPPGDTPALVTFNPVSIRRSDLITVRTPGINHEVFIDDLPPMGIKVVPWDSTFFDSMTELPVETTIENDFYRLQFDSQHGTVTSLIDKETGKEWVDQPLGAVIYETADPSDDHPAIHIARNHFHPDTPGPRFIRTVADNGSAQLRRTHYGMALIMATSAPYLPRIRTTVRLFNTMKWVEFSFAIEKRENYDMEGVYVAFPFALEKPTFWLETANAVYRADQDQLPDTCRDWYSIQHSIGVTNGEHSVLWGTREAPLVQLDQIQTGKWRSSLDATHAHIYSWLMNNLYFTNFKASQGGRTEFTFRFTTIPGVITEAEVQAWGISFGNPSLGTIVPLQPGNYQWLDVQPGTVLVQSLQQSLVQPGAYTLRLKETAGQMTNVALKWLGYDKISIEQIDYLEMKTAQPISSDGQIFYVQIRPYQLLTLRLTK